MQRRPILFVGSGLSLNSGFPAASELAANIRRGLRSRGELDERADGILKCVLPEVVQYAKSVKGKCYSEILADAFGPAWPPHQRRPWLTLEESIKCHFENTLPFPVAIPHVVIARLAREGLISEIVTTNYDCLLEFACWSTGMEPHDAHSHVVSGDSTLFHPSSCRDRLTVLTSKSYWGALRYPSVLTIAKIHGGIEDALEDAGDDGSCPERSGRTRMAWRGDCDLVLAWEDVVDWRKSSWARPLFYDRAYSSLMILTGFSAADPYLFGSFMEALTMRVPNAEKPAQSLIVLDPTSNVYLLTLAKQGEGTNQSNSGQTSNVLTGPPCRAEGAGSCCPDSATCPYAPASGTQDDNRDAMAGLYTDLYVAVSITILRNCLRSHGLETIIDLLGGDEAAISIALEAVDGVDTFLRRLAEDSAEWPPGFSRARLIMDFLPSAVANSWAMNLSPRDIGRVGQWRNRTHLYLPLLENLRAAYVILLYIAQLHDKAGRCGSCLIPCADGTVEVITPEGPRSYRRLLPVFVDMTGGPYHAHGRERAAADPRMAASLVRSRLFRFRRPVPEADPVVLTGIRPAADRPDVIVLGIKDVLQRRP